jgi:hypothetical protein
MGLATISYDSQQILADFATRHGITFPMLSDVGSPTIKRYGILNTVIEEALGPHGKDPAVLADLQRSSPSLRRRNDSVVSRFPARLSSTARVA